MKSIFGKTCIRVLILCAALFLLSPPSGMAQREKKKDERLPMPAYDMRTHSPHKATLWALLPGAGQVYNKKYWKLPIVYAGFGVIGYFAFFARGEYIKYNDAYVCSAKADADTAFVCTNPLGSLATSDLLSFRDYYRRNMELSFILMGAWYILQMLDATVDAHLFYWEVDDDLSVRLDPVYQPLFLPTRQPAYNGLKITVRF